MKNYEDLYVRIEKGIREAHSKILLFKKQLLISDSVPETPLPIRERGGSERERAGSVGNVGRGAQVETGGKEENLNQVDNA